MYHTTRVPLDVVSHSSPFNLSSKQVLAAFCQKEDMLLMSQVTNNMLSPPTLPSPGHAQIKVESSLDYLNVLIQLRPHLGKSTLKKKCMERSHWSVCVIIHTSRCSSMLST